MTKNNNSKPFGFANDDIDTFNDFLGDEDMTKSTPEQGENLHGATGANVNAKINPHTIYKGQEANLPPYEPNNFTGGGLFVDGVEANHEGNPLNNEQQLVMPGAEYSDEELLAICTPRICAQCPVQKEATDAKLRSLAEIDNARKRMAREKEEFTRYASEGVISEILPALDNLDLALQHAGKDAASQNLAIGVDMTKKLMLESLKKHGLVQVGVVGEPFDPALHEAVGTEYVEGIEQDHVARLLSHGYTLHERLIRPAKVMVCKQE